MALPAFLEKLRSLVTQSGVQETREWAGKLSERLAEMRGVEVEHELSGHPGADVPGCQFCDQERWEATDAEDWKDSR